MSTIESLSIQGIRSFGVEKDDRQSITFSSPLTLILGANGCGKTTIIECLKYALTGEMPPGSNRGQSFIHDPKIFNFIECLGQIKLVVKNIRNEKLTVTRSMKMGQKRGKPSFETLDTTVGFQSNEGDAVISKRCIDVDAEMCQFIGVSKAIINNVIFCHQEDSSWPLDEAKKLKEKFDAIFGTTEYNKAIDRIIKLRKEQQDDLRIKESSLKYLDHMKKETESKTLDLQNAEKKLSELQQTCTEFEAEIKPVEERLSKIYHIELKIGQLQSQKIELSTNLNNCKEQAKNLTLKIKNIFEGNIHQLDREIRDFHDKMEEKQSELQNVEHQLQSIKTQEKKIQSNLTDLDRKRTSLIHQRQQEQEFISERARKISELCQHLNIPVHCDLEESDNEVSKILDTIKSGFKREEEKISDMSTEHDKKDQEKQTEIDKLREEKAAVESDILSKKSQKEQLEKEQKKLDTEIATIEASAQTLKEVTKEIEKIAEVYNNLNQSVNLEEIKQKIDEKKKNVGKLQENLEKLDDKLTFLNSISKLTAEISLKQKELEKREQEAKRLKNKHSDKFKKIFPHRTIEANFKRNVQSAHEDIQKQIKDLNIKINANKLKERELELNRKSQKDKLVKYEKELEECEDKIFVKCHSTPYEELLERCKENIQKLQLDLGALKSAEAMYKKYIQKIEEDPCCPLCHKSMSQNEASDLTNELSDEIHHLPDNIQRTEMLLKKEQIKYEGLLSLKSVIERKEFLKEDIPKCKMELKATEENLATVANEVECFQMLTAEPNSNLELVNSMLGDMSLLDEAVKDISRIEVDLEKLKTKLPEGSTVESIDVVQTEKSVTATELKNERTELDKLQTEYEKGNDVLNKLREKRNNLKDKQIKLQEGVQTLTQLKSRRDEVFSKIETTAKEIGELQQRLQPLKQRLNKCIEEKQILKNEHKELFGKATSRLGALKKIDHEIERYNKELKALKELNLATEIERLKETMKRYLDEQKIKAQENAETVELIEKLKIEIFNQEALERDLKDNKELKVIQQREKQLQEQYDELAKDIGELDFKNVSKEKEALAKKRDNITVKKGEILGQMGEVNNQINKLRNELNEPKYKDSIKNFRKSFYEVEILRKIITDFGQYRVALEWALLKFHSEKMEKINRLIRELWRQVYRGNDIDYIQIQTDEIKSEGTDKKRSYNYRVVQSKNNSEIDMRGRCSAGQRVLASLIIRMALAETFSTNCGVLALDEPTTNLDRDNILALCEALNRIVEERQTQSNFMLIIITHDEGFISTLGRIRSYHKVFRNDDGKSIIRKVKVA